MSKSKEMEELLKRPQFIELAKEVYPLLVKIEEVFTKSDFGDGVRMTISKDGYMEFTPYHSKWHMSRYEPGKEPTICFDYRESFTGEEKE